MSTTTAKIDRKSLVHAFREAAAAALAADPGQDADGGTCNFDSPTIFLPGVREKLVQECAAEAGIGFSARKWFGRRYFFVETPAYGQANRRSIMAEAACRRLEEMGLKAVLYCQAD
jgi:hypothetical protein